MPPPAPPLGRQETLDHASSGCFSKLQRGVSSATYYQVAPWFRYAHAIVTKSDASTTPGMPMLRIDSLPAPRSRESPELNIGALDAMIKASPRAPLALTLARFLRPFSGRCVLHTGFTTLGVVCLPVVSRQIVLGVDGALSASTAYAWVAGFSGLVVVTAYTGRYGWDYSTMGARCVSMAATGLMFEKRTRMTTTAFAPFSEGAAVNMMQTDCGALLELLNLAPLYLTAAVMAGALPVMLVLELGLFALPALALMVVDGYLVWRVADRLGELQKKKNGISDVRVSKLTETFDGMRTVKAQGWDDVVGARVERERAKEIACLRTMALLRATQYALGIAFPMVCCVGSVLLKTRVTGRAIAPDELFYIISVFTFAIWILLLVPMVINNYKTLRISVARLHPLLTASEDFRPPKHDDETGGGARGGAAVRVAGAEFRWESASALPAARDGGAGEKPEAVALAKAAADASEAPAVLSDVSFDVGAPEIVAVVGRKAEGKSTLAAGILGQIECSRGRVHVRGSVSYIAQTAFITNASIRENILFGAPFDEKRYEKVIDACALGPDLKTMKAGDGTEVGERGVTLSGGQKQRVALARAAYADADVVVADDPLSAMDAHVALHVFKKCFRGLLRSKSVLFLTNQINFAASCDKIIFLDGGKASVGTYRELCDASAAFAQLAEYEVGSVDGGMVVIDFDEKSEQEQEESTVASAPAKDDSPAGVNSSAEEVKEGGAVEESKEDKKAEQAKEAQAEKEAKGKIMKREKQAQGKHSLQTWFDMGDVTKTRVMQVIVLLMVVVAPAIKFLNASYAQVWADRGGESSQAKPILNYLLTGLGFALATFVQQIAYNLFFLYTSRSLHQQQLTSVLRSPMEWWDTTPKGVIIARFSMDFMLLDIFLPQMFNFFCDTWMNTLIVLVPSTMIIPHMAPASLLFLVVCYKLYGLYSRVSVEVFRLQLMAGAPMVGSFGSFLQGIDTIRAFGRVDAFRATFRTHVQNRYRAPYAFNVLQNLFFTVLSGPVCGAYAAILGVLLIKLRGTGFVSTGKAGLIYAFLNFFPFQVSAVFTMSTMMESFMSSAERVIEYIRLEPEREAASPATPRAWPRKGDIVIEDVCMRYRAGLPLVIDRVSVHFTGGEKVGICGRTGSGKSSLVQCLLRIVALERGRVTIDGEDAAQLALRTLRRAVGFVPQDPFVWNGTLRENVDVLGKARGDADLRRVLEMVGLTQIVAEFPDGLDHVVSDKGENLSAGTRQLVCLARVLLQDPRIILMDEATANVDIETDARVQTAIRSAFAEQTVIVIAHRLGTIIDFDKILVLDKGKVSEFDAPATLLENSSGALSALVDDTGASTAGDLRRRASEKAGRTASVISHEQTTKTACCG